jgi:hypothetical protein
MSDNEWENDMERIGNRTCLEMDNVWWSLKFCSDEKTQTICLKFQQNNALLAKLWKKKTILVTSIQENNILATFSFYLH